MKLFVPALQDLMGIPVQLNIEEVRKPEIDATLIAQSIAQQLEKESYVQKSDEKSDAKCYEIGSAGN